MFSLRAMKIFCVALLFLARVDSALNRRGAARVDPPRVKDQMTEFPEADFQPFFQDLRIKPRYLQGAYSHPIKISRLSFFGAFFGKTEIRVRLQQPEGHFRG